MYFSRLCTVETTLNYTFNTLEPSRILSNPLEPSPTLSNPLELHGTLSNPLLNPLKTSGTLSNPLEPSPIYTGVCLVVLVLNLPIILLTENTINTREAKVFMSCPFNRKIILL